MKQVFSLLFIAFLFLTGCGQQDTNKPAALIASTVVTAKPSPTNAPTPEDWRSAVESTYQEIDPKDIGEGVTEFSACFKKEDERCENFAFGSRDAFRKLRFYTPGLTSESAVGTYLISYITLKDNQAPRILLAPMIFSKNGWLFINHVAIMVDGEVILEQDIGNFDVKRDTFPGGVQERFDFIASDAQVAALRKIKPESKVIVRITGDKGYVSIEKQRIQFMKAEISNLLYIYDKLNTAIAGKTISDTE